MKKIFCYLLLLFQIYNCNGIDDRISKVHDFLQNQVISQSRNTLILENFKKTNGYDKNILGQNYYILEWEATISSKQDIWKPGNNLVGYWQNFEVMTKQPGYWDSYAVGGTKKIFKGAIIQIFGDCQLLKTENGWRVEGLDVKSYRTLNEGEEEKIDLEVILKDAEGSVLLEQYESGKWVTKFSATINNERAVFNGYLEYPEMYYISLNGERTKLPIFIENSKIKVEGKSDSLKYAKISGSISQNEYNSVIAKVEKITNESMALYQKSKDAKAAGDIKKAEQLNEQFEKLFETTNTVKKDFVKNNPNSFVTPYFLWELQTQLNDNEMEAILNNLSPRIDNLPIINNLRKNNEKSKNISVGLLAPDFTLNDIAGNPVRFSSIYSKNRFTLVDFWASWCAPCRQENPNILEVFNTFNSKGFNVFGVSLDRTKEDWLKAIENDGLKWQQVSDLLYWNNAAAKLYGINTIPFNLIVDQNGKIIAKNIKGEALRLKISDLLKQ